MKLARAFWSFGSILMNVVIGIYIYLMNTAPQDRAARYQYMNDNWDVFGGHWKAEFLIVTMITIGAVYFMLQTRKLSWTTVSMGQIILLLTYPFMLGGYRNTSLELAEMSNEMATIVFIFGNLILMGGLFMLYVEDTVLAPWLRVVSFSISAFMGLVFLAIYMGFFTWGQALVVAPLANVLYFINAYYGFKFSLESETVDKETAILV